MEDGSVTVTKASAAADEAALSPSVSSEDGNSQRLVYGGSMSSAVSVYPAAVVSVEGLSEDTPVSEIAALLKEHGIKPSFIDRSAILKFKRHHEV